MGDLLIEISLFFQELWFITKEAAPYLLLGLFFAGIIKAFLKDEFIQKHLGKNDWKSVLKAAFFGVPLPLCSCGVIPTAVSLRKQGASKSATTAFLISTPESGVDSIAISYALLDPIMTVIRPIAGFITAVISGIIETFYPDEKMDDTIKEESCCSTEEVIEAVTESPLIQISGLSKKTETKSCCGTEELVDDSEESCCSEPVVEEASCCSTEAPKEQEESIGSRIYEGLKYSYINLMKDLSYTLIIGLFLAAAISYFIPESFFENYLSHPIGSLFIMLLIGIPMYICATSSTPIAAAMIMKGLSPGAAIVFLIAGPATNLASIVVLQKMLGKSTVVRYLSSIVIMSLLFGLLTNFIYQYASFPIMMMGKQHAHTSLLGIDGLDFVLTIIFIVFLFYGLWNEKLKKYVVNK